MWPNSVELIQAILELATAYKNKGDEAKAKTVLEPLASFGDAMWRANCYTFTYPYDTDMSLVVKPWSCFVREVKEDEAASRPK